VSNGNGRNPDKAETQRREARSIEMRQMGATYEAIADDLGLLSRSAAYRTVMRALSRHGAEEVGNLRMVEGARLDALHSVVWDQALTGDYAAINTVLKIMERRARLFGLDQAQRVAVKSTPALDAEIETLIDELRSLPPETGSLEDGSH